MSTVLRRSWSRRARLPLALGGLAVLLACSSGGSRRGGDGASPEVKSPYPKVTSTTRVSYRARLPDGSMPTLESENVGEKVIAGRSFPRTKLSEPGGAGGASFEAWVDLRGDTLELGGAELILPPDALPTFSGYAAVTAIAPPKVSLSPPVGEPQSVSMPAQGVFDDPGATPEPVTVTGSFTLDERDVGVRTPAGLLSGCSRYVITTVLPRVTGAGVPVDAEAYYHPRLGLVHADLLSPLLGTSLSFQGSKDVSELGGGLYSVQGVSVLGGDGATRFAIDTYDVAQDLDADKNTHAKMLLEVRWTDDEQAKGSEQPPVTEEFGTVMGNYPSRLVESPVSYFFPEERGFKHWIGFVDQAAKNEPGDGTSYHVSVRASDAGMNPVRVAARIVYRRLEPGTP